MHQKKTKSKKDPVESKNKSQANMLLLDQKRSIPSTVQAWTIMECVLE
jgi:hypothetical protein